MFAELGSKFTSLLSCFDAYPCASDRSAYDNLYKEDKEKAVKNAEKYLGFEFKAIPITAFMEYSRTGNRSNFESLNFSKRYALNALIVGECVENSGRFLDDILNGIYSLCEESAWQLPAHNSYIRDTPSFNLPDVTDPVIDLFAAETGALLSMAKYLLFDDFEKINPFINKMIDSILEKRIYTPYINRHFWWMGNGDEKMCNWTVWCTQNVLLSVFLNKNTSDELRRSVFKKACKSIDAFLKDYGVDGCCDEGAHYYRHSALCLFNCAFILNNVTGGFFDSVFNEEKIKNIATYIFNVNIEDKYYFNFADCSAVIDRAGAREYLFAKAIGNLDMMRFAARDFKIGDDEKNEGELNLFYCIQELFTSAEIKDFDTDLPIVHKDFYYESVGLFIARGDKFALAVKAGNNGDSHNHNDTGSVIVYKEGKPVLIDVGVETYTKKTFSSERYDIWTMQSQYHNLPTINNVMQKDGADYKATDVEYFLSDSISDIKMDIAKAYTKDAGVKSYKRHVSLYKSKQIVIEDEIEFTKGDISSNSFFLSFMTYEKPVISGNDVLIGNCKMQIIGDSLISYEEIPITDERLKWSWKHDIYRIIVTPRVQKLMIALL